MFKYDKMKMKKLNGCWQGAFHSMEIAYEIFFRTKGLLRIFDGFFLKTKGFLPKVYEIFGSEMALGCWRQSSVIFHLPSARYRSPLI